MRKTKIEDFKGFEFEIDMQPIIDKNANEAMTSLQNGPSWKRNRRTGNTYNQGWEVETYDETSKSHYSAVVWNATNWQLTWLLEHGHLITNKKGGVGWASGKRHIEPVYDAQSKKFIKDMEDVKINSK